MVSIQRHSFCSTFAYSRTRHFVLLFFVYVWATSCLVYSAMDDTQRMMQMSGFGFDPSKVYHLRFCRFSLNPTIKQLLFSLQSLGAEKDGIDIIQHDWALPKLEKRAEDALKKLLK
ncbi:hypothetical protein BHE74_00004725 [Ensete ventricosum]|nr:hypothetical protein BHE74_00004725 [Ensete ventricosum]